MEIQLTFKNPNQVSEYQLSDQLCIEFEENELFVDQNTGELIAY